MRLLSTSEWHHVRYVMPMVAMVLAAGLIGYARLANWLLPRRGGRAWLAMVWARRGPVLRGRPARRRRIGWRRVPVPIDREEAEQVWSWIRQVGPDDAVMVDYEVSAPLSSRRQIYGCEPRRQPAAGLSPASVPSSAGSSSATTNRFS